MSPSKSQSRLSGACAKLSPYLARLVELGGLHAGALHSEQTSAEHLFCALMDQEESAASQAVAHAFADPETLFAEGLAICDGWLVVGSKSTLPFSPRAVTALASAHRARGGKEVEPRAIAESSLARLSEPQRERIQDHVPSLPPLAAEAEAPPALGGASPFADFSGNGKQALARANHAAAALGARAIGPVHLILGALAVDDQALTGEVRATRLRAAWSDLHEDASPAPAPAPPSEAFLNFLEGLPAEADSLVCLTALQAKGPAEVNEILVRNRITAAFLERAATAFGDPDELPEPR